MNIRRYAVVLAGAIALLFVSAVHAAEETPKPEFRVTDAYFQVGYQDSDPMYLLKDSVIKPYGLERGEAFRLWLTFELKNSPCASREKTKCTMFFELTDSDRHTWKMWRGEYVLDSQEVHVSVPGRVPLEASLGSATIRIIYAYGHEQYPILLDKHLLTFLVPITVR